MGAHHRRSTHRHIWAGYDLNGGAAAAPSRARAAAAAPGPEPAPRSSLLARRVHTSRIQLAFNFTETIQPESFRDDEYFRVLKPAGSPRMRWHERRGGAHPSQYAKCRERPAAGSAASCRQRREPRAAPHMFRALETPAPPQHRAAGPPTRRGARDDDISCPIDHCRY